MNCIVRKPPVGMLKNTIEDVPKHVGPNLVFADDDQQRSRPGRLAKHSAFGLLLLPAGYLTPPVDFVTFFVTDGRTDELKVFWAFYRFSAGQTTITSADRGDTTYSVYQL